VSKPYISESWQRAGLETATSDAGLEAVAREWLESQIPGQWWAYNRTLLFDPLVALLRSRDERALRIVREVRGKLSQRNITSRTLNAGAIATCDEIERRIKRGGR